MTNILKEKLKKSQGITLIALVITIIVLLILAVVTIATLTGENGILSKAIQAEEHNNIANVKEKINLLMNEWRMQNTVNGISLNEFLADKKEKGEIYDYYEANEEYTILIDGYQATIDLNGNLVSEIIKIGQTPPAEKPVDLTGKTIIYFGSTLADDTWASDGKSYISMLTERNQMVKDVKQNSTLDQIKMSNVVVSYLLTSEAQTLTETDLILVEPMYNWSSASAGSLTPNETNTFDATTTYGAFEKMMYTYIQSGIKAKFGIIIPGYAKTNSASITSRVPIVIDVCNKYNIPYLNLAEKIISGDYVAKSDSSVFLTKESNEKMSYDVENWLKNVLGGSTTPVLPQPPEEDGTENVDTNSPLQNNKIVTYGTSITVGQGATTNWGKEIATRNNMTHTNYAIGGASAIKTLETYTANKNLSSMTSLTENDYVIFEGIFNNVSIPLGFLTPEGTNTFDTTTVYGAVEKTIYDYINSECKAKVGYVLTHFSINANNNPEKYNLIWNVAVDVCTKYNIPLLDLRNKNYDLQSDGVHLTNTGEMSMSKDIENWLKTI